MGMSSAVNSTLCMNARDTGIAYCEMPPGSAEALRFMFGLRKANLETRCLGLRSFVLQDMASFLGSLDDVSHLQPTVLGSSFQPKAPLESFSLRRKKSQWFPQETGFSLFAFLVQAVGFCSIAAPKHRWKPGRMRYCDLKRIALMSF